MPDRDVITNGRPFTVQIGEGHPDTDIALRIRDSSGVQVACIFGDGSFEFKKARLTNIPTSSTGLSAGDLWNDGGIVKVI